MDNWQHALQNDSLSFIALFAVALYLDFVVRRDENERAKLSQQQLEAGISTEVFNVIQRELSSSATSMQQEFRDVSRQLDEELSEKIQRLVLAEVQLVVTQAIQNPLNLVDPRECVAVALERKLQGHSECFSYMMDGIIGQDDALIIDDASLKFTLASSPGTEYIDVKYCFTGLLRQSKYRLMLANTGFRSESRIHTSGTVTDAWLLLDHQSFAATVDLATKNSAELRYRNKSGMYIREQRQFVPEASPFIAPELTECQTYSVDLSPPADLVGRCESSIEVYVRLPARPVGLRWFFDHPIFVHEITFDVSGLWPDEEIDFTLYPFLLGTEDYTQRSDKRQPVYRMGIHSWLSRGHGVILIWERLGVLKGRLSRHQ